MTTENKNHNCVLIEFSMYVNEIHMTSIMDWGGDKGTYMVVCFLHFMSSKNLTR